MNFIDAKANVAVSDHSREGAVTRPADGFAYLAKANEVPRPVGDTV